MILLGIWFISLLLDWIIRPGYLNSINLIITARIQNVYPKQLGSKSLINTIEFETIEGSNE